MSSARSLVRVVPLGFALVAAGVSCGGSTEHDGSGSSGGSSAGAAGKASSGGSGAVGTGGFAAGGSVGVAGGSSSGGSAGGSTIPDFCTLPAESGMCDAYIPSFYFDPATGSCKSFVYGGCGGNENRFATSAECRAACGAAVPRDDCNQPADCALVSVDCCACPSASLSSYAAINVNAVDDFRDTNGCTGVICEPCLAPDPLSVTDQYFAATCVMNECVPIDLRQTDATGCNVSTDCFLRLGTGCCEGCGGEDQLVAISSAQWLMDLVCGDAPVPCPACAPMLPEGYVPGCENGVCTVEASDQP